MAKREFLQLAHKYTDGSFIGGWMMSEKLDGERCFWDGGLTTGIFKSEVPWANTAKDRRYIGLQVASGLWSRYGNVIHAPPNWLALLPKVPMDGELWSPGLSRQEIHSRIKKLETSDSDWEDIKFYAFAVPPFETVFADGLIDNTNMKVSFKGIKAFITDRLRHKPLVYYPKNPTSPWQSCILGFKNKFGDEVLGNTSFKLHRQQDLSYDHDNSQEAMHKYLDMVVDSGGEGLMLRRPDKPYECCRSHFLLKVKPFDDAEGTVIGYTTGRATDKGSRLLGKMGAMILQLGPQFGSNTMELSGFTDEERILCERDGIKSELYASDWAIKNPGVEVPERIEAKMFPRGTVVSFRYRGTNDSGIPNEARFWRKDERI